MKLPRPLSPALAAACTLLALSAPAQAAVIGYWRFEDSGNLGTDSSGSGMNLNLGTSPAAVAPAANFPTIVPQTGAANSGAADFEVSSAQFLAVADSSALAFQDFTIEAFINLESVDSATGVRSIASQFATNQVAWNFAVTGANASVALGNRNLILQLSPDGTNIVTLDSDFALTVGVSYYVAVSVDFTPTGTNATFYVQNLTTTTLQSAVDSDASITSMHNSTANFSVGSTTGSRNFDGVLDEVRLSNTTLSQSDLLIVPEPGSGALALGILGLWLCFGRGFFFQNRKGRANN